MDSGGKAPSMSSCHLPSGTWAFSRSFLGAKSNHPDEAGFGRKSCGREVCGLEGFPDSCSGLNIILRTHELMTENMCVSLLASVSLLLGMTELE